jgi:hypothetical protein
MFQSRAGARGPGDWWQGTALESPEPEPIVGDDILASHLSGGKRGGQASSGPSGCAGPSGCPTICHRASRPVPAHEDGGVQHQALESPDGRLEELRWLRENDERVEAAIEAGRNLTRTYGMQPREGP